MSENTAPDNHYQPKTNFEGTPAPQAEPEAEPRALTSEEFTGLKLGHPKTTAAGVMAVVKSMEHITRESGLVRGNKVLLQLNQKGGFDCPGCAWPDPDDERSKFEYCENGAKAVAEETTLKRVTPEFFAAHSVEEMSTWSDKDIGKSGRLTHPMLLEPGGTHYKPVSWDEAFAILSEELNALQSPDEATFYTSGRTSNEAAFLYQLFAREYGTNNLPDCSNMCHESSGCAMTETIGVGKGTVSLEDFSKADSIWIFGQNPGTNHPRMLTALQKARQRNNCEIVAVNPLPEAGLLGFQHPQHPLDLVDGGTRLATLHLPVTINGDVALLKAVMKAMLEREDEVPGQVFDLKFIQEHTHGYQEFIADLRAENWEDLLQGCGLSREEINKAATIAIHSKRMICCWAMGMTQHKNAVGGIQEIINFLLLGGHIGREGAGACPVRGHSNVQGDRTMGIWERPKAEFLDALQNEFGFEPPRKHGYDVVEGIKAMHEGKAHVFFAMGGNFLSATPDTDFTAEALRKCRLTAHVSTKLHRGHLVTGRRALILPCLGRTERDVQNGKPQFVSVENSMGVVHTSEGRLEPASEHLKSEPAIVIGLAKAVLGDKSTLDWDQFANYDEIRGRVERVIDGFQNYNERVRTPQGFYLPNTAKERVWKTENGKANFTVHAPAKHTLEADQLMMMTIRSHDQYNTTIYGLDDRYRGIYNERRVVMMNAADITARGLDPGDVVDLTSHFEDEERRAPHFIVVEYPIPKGCAATYFPETNVLVPIKSVAEKSNTPTSKSVVIRVHKSGAQ